MLQANPLRSKMYVNLKFDEHLVKKTDGSWWLIFNRNEFKNRKHLNSDYEVRVAPELWQLIDEYKTIYWRKLIGSTQSQYVFPRKSSTKKPDQKDLKPGGGLLYQDVRNRTKQYIPDCDGFGLHSFRHLIATDIIKNDPRWGFFLAANVLNDKLETVERNYAHLKTSEFFEPYNDIYSEAWRNITPSIDPYHKDSYIFRAGVSI